MELFGLFLSAFISSTLFPGGSEAVLAWLSASRPDYGTVLLLAVATLGNTLGGMTSWLIGWWVVRLYPARQLRARHEAALRRLRRHGAPLLLFSWLPIIGDPLCLAAGWLRIGWLPALLFIALGKALRYSAVLLAFR